MLKKSKEINYDTATLVIVQKEIFYHKSSPLYLYIINTVKIVDKMSTQSHKREVYSKLSSEKETRLPQTLRFIHHKPCSARTETAHKNGASPRLD